MVERGTRPTGPVTVRPFAEDEWQVYKELRLRALREHPGMFFSPYARAAAYSEAQWREMLDQQGKCVFGVFDGDRPIGVTGIVPSREDTEGKTGVLVMSYLLPDFRGRGLSRLLYQGRIDWAIGHTPWARLVVSHRAGNEASRRANQAFGFVLVSKEVIRWPDGTDAEEWKYSLDLDTLRSSPPNAMVVSD